MLCSLSAGPVRKQLLPFNGGKGTIPGEDFGILRSPELLGIKTQGAGHFLRTNHQVGLGQGGGGTHGRVQCPVYLLITSISLLIWQSARRQLSCYHCRQPSVYLPSARLSGAVPWKLVHILVFKVKILQH